MGKSSGGVRGVTAADISAVTVKDIRNSFSQIGAYANNFYRTSLSQQISDNEVRRIMQYLDKDSLAYKIIRDFKLHRGLTEKQEWVIAYQLMKNKNYVREVAISKKRKEAERVARKAQKPSRTIRRGK